MTKSGDRHNGRQPGPFVSRRRNIESNLESPPRHQGRCRRVISTADGKMKQVGGDRPELLGSRL